MASRCYFQTKPFLKLTPEERRYLGYLTLKGESYMRIDVLQKKPPKFENQLSEYQVFLVKEGTSIVGWSVIFPEKYAIDRPSSSKDYCLYIYIKWSHRRKKLGSKLLRYALRWAARKKYKVNAFPWDKRSDEFYENNTGKYKVCSF